MTYSKQTIWRLVQLCAQELTRTGITPFTRQDIVHGVQRKNPRYGADSINPIIQGLTDNLRGGAPGAVGKDILHSVGRGLFVLKDGSTEHKKSPNTVKRGQHTGPKASGINLSVRLAMPADRSNNRVNVRIGQYDFIFISLIEPERNIDGSIKEYMPQSRYENSSKLSLNKYGKGPFCKFKIPRDIELAGIYALNANDKVKYIGECEALSSRFNMGYGNISPRNCFIGGQETNCRINSIILESLKKGTQISLWFHQSAQYKQIEQELREFISPEWNRC